MTKYQGKKDKMAILLTGESYVFVSFKDQPIFIDN